VKGGDRLTEGIDIHDQNPMKATPQASELVVQTGPSKVFVLLLPKVDLKVVVIQN
jgi:hypothetical protein